MFKFKESNSILKQNTASSLTSALEPWMGLGLLKKKTASKVRKNILYDNQNV